MPGKFSTLLGSRRVTVALLSLFFMLVVVVVVIGLNNVTGIVIAYVTVTLLFLILTRNWRRIRYFVILFFVALMSIFLLSFLYVEVIYRLAVMIGGIDALQGTAFKIIHLVTSDVILLACPSGMFVGIVGASTLGIMRLSSLRRKKSAAGT